METRGGLVSERSDWRPRVEEAKAPGLKRLASLTVLNDPALLGTAEKVCPDSATPLVNSVLQ